VGAARLMNRNGLPGCVVPDKLLVEIEGEAKATDKGKGKRFERAAKMYAILKGMGYAGTHIAGHNMSYDDLEMVIGRGEELAPNWPDLVREFDYPQEGGWYYFERDEGTGLNRAELTNRSERPKAGIGYKAMRVLHDVLFENHGAMFGPMQKVAKAVDGSAAEPVFTRLEQMVKGLTNDCMHCGDCAMFDIGYLCPQSQCAKNQRNGPCGGSYEGWCEKFPGEKQCMYVRAYDRLKAYGEEESLGQGPNPPIDHELYQTSSWINYYLGRDHSADAKGIPTVEPNQKKSK